MDGAIWRATSSPWSTSTERVCVGVMVRRGWTGQPDRQPHDSRMTDGGGGGPGATSALSIRASTSRAPLALLYSGAGRSSAAASKPGVLDVVEATTATSDGTWRSALQRGIAPSAM